MNVDHLSVSALQKYQRCGVQYEFRYVKKIPEPSTSAAIRGTAVHKSVKKNMYQKVKSRADLAVEELRQEAADQVAAGFAGEVALLPEEQSSGLSRVKDATVDLAVSLATLHRDRVAPAIQPVAVEQKITLTPAAGPLPKLVGYLDLEDDRGFIHDTKTKTKKPPATQAATSQQLTMYEILYRAKNGKPSNGMLLETLVETQAGNKSVDVQATTRSDAAIGAFVGTMERAVEGIRKGVFVPTNPDNWCCSAKWCGYWNVCPYVKK